MLTNLVTLIAISVSLINGMNVELSESAILGSEASYVNQSEEYKLTERKDELMQVMWQKVNGILSQDESLSDEFWWQTAVDDADRMLERFLIGNSWNVDSAVTYFKSYLTWRREFKVRDLIYSGEHDEALVKRALFESGKGIFWGYDKEGFLVILLYPRHHNMWTHSIADTTRHIVYQTELGRRLFKPGKDRVTVIIDLNGLSVNSMDVNCALFVLNSLRHYYPECINRICLINIPYIFGYLYAAVEPMIGFLMKKLVRFTDPKMLLTVIDEDQLFREYGGLCEYKYNYVPPDVKLRYDKEGYERLLAEAKILTRQFYESDDRELIPKIKDCYTQLDHMLYPGDHYSRLGVYETPRQAKFQ